MWVVRWHYLYIKRFLRFKERCQRGQGSLNLKILDKKTAEAQVGE